MAHLLVNTLQKWRNRFAAMGTWDAVQENVRRLTSIKLAMRLVWQGAPRWTLISFVIIAIQSVLPLFTLFLQKRLVDTILAGVLAPNKRLVFEHVGVILLLGAGVGIVEACSRAIASYVGEAQAQNVGDYVQSMLQRKSVEVDLGYYENPSYFDKLHRAQQESSYRPVRVVNALAQLARSAITLLAMAGLLLTLNWSIALLILVATLPGVIVRFRFAGVMYRWQTATTQRQRLAGYYGWMLMDGWHAKEIRLFGLGPLFAQKFEELRAGLRKERLALALRRSRQDLLAQIATQLAIYTMYAYIAWMTMRGVITMGSLVMYEQAFQRAQSALLDILSGLAALYDDSLYLSNLYEFLELQPVVVSPQEPEPVPIPLQKGIVFENVCFRYPLTTRPVLEDFSLEIAPGQIVALVGNNGSGKTTLTKLLCRFYDPQAGRILLDGADLRTLDVNALRRHIAVVMQDFMRYSLPLADNIWLGNIEAPRDCTRIAEAGQAAGLDSLVATLPEGYETVLGRLFDTGEELSVGEWQKLALARAYIRNADILILDEPTSAMDPRAERDFIASLAALAKNKTTLLISHRLSTVRLAHKICVLEEGRIVETGTHDELLANNGLYATIYRAQSAPYLEEPG